jgi:multidrug efflux system membrane fusion protein
MALSQPGQRKWRGVFAASCPAATITGIKIMSLQKTWVNFHLTRWGAVIAMLLRLR